MPRTIESIVACHREASARRRAGKRVWDATIRVKDVLAEYEEAGDDLTPAQAVEMSRRIAALLKVGVPAAWRQPEHNNFTMDFEDLFERFEQATAGDFTPTSEFPETACEVINAWLDELYDWGDRCRVWMG